MMMMMMMQDTDNSETDSKKEMAQLKRKLGPGLSVVKLERENLSERAQEILSDLLHQHDIKIDHKEAVTPPKKKARKPLETNMSDERVMQLAQQGELSFLASLLRVLEEENAASLSTKFLMKSCCLAVEPALVPALCDAKEMVMAGLHFLSSNFTSGSPDFPNLPLIRAVSETSDLERRSYEKVGDWRLAEILEQVLNLEQVFFESQNDYKWMARHHACPNLTTGRDLLLLKGSPPAFLLKPKKVARRKSSTGKPGGAGVEEEAKRIMRETTEDQPQSDEH
jgi:hypothetical protein